MRKLKYSHIISCLIILFSLIIVMTLIKYSNGKTVNKEITESSVNIGAADTSTVSVPVSNNNPSTKAKFTVVVDPGHGAVDPGSIGARGTLEKDLTLSIALKLGKILESKGIDVVYTRKDDKFEWTGQKEDLLSRAEVANNNSADLFISIHMNSSEYKDARGTETYYHPTSTKGKKLAAIIQEQVVNEVNLRDRGIKPEDYSVLRNVSAPSVLIELGYLSNYNEEALLRDASYHDKFAKAIAEGILKYIES